MPLSVGGRHGMPGCVKKKAEERCDREQVAAAIQSNGKASRRDAVIGQ